MDPVLRAVYTFEFHYEFEHNEEFLDFLNTLREQARDIPTHVGVLDDWDLQTRLPVNP